MNSQPTFRPLARTASLITKAADGELLIYDLDADRAHCLNPAACAIWQRCDGRLTIRELAKELSATTGTRLNEDYIQFAVNQFVSANLLANPDGHSSPSVHISRRTLLRRVGLTAALLPLVTSITAPTASAAASCTGSCNPSQPNKGCAVGCTCTAIGNKCVNV